jgi:hypothetical protein
MKNIQQQFPKCNAMNHDGVRCRGRSAILHNYHGDSNLYRNFSENDVTWVKVNLCIKHAVAVDHDFIKK